MSMYGCSMEYAVDTNQPAAASIESVWSILILTIISGAFGGFVHALENDRTHEIKLPFHGKEADSGIWGHVFIGMCGSVVALAVVMAIFNFEINPTDAEETLSTAIIIKKMFYVSAVGIVGGYSGLPIISMVSNAALKKVQRQVDALETDGAEQKKEIKKLKEEEDQQKLQLFNMSNELTQKNTQLKESQLQITLLTAESHARNERYSDCITLLTDKYLPQDDKNAKAWMWLAFCEKRLNNIQKAYEYICKSLELEETRLAYFNKACYTFLLGRPEQDVYSCLRLAWQHATNDIDKKRFLAGLLNDKDFNKLREQESFKGFRSEFDADIQNFDIEQDK